MLRSVFGFLVLSAAMAAVAQQAADPAKSDQSNGPGSSPASSSSPQTPAKPAPNLAPPRSDRVDAGALGEQSGESSSKNTQIDLSPPENDDRAHPHSADALADVTADTAGTTGVGEFHIWDPHKAAKSVEVGDFYFKRKNYRAAEERYREALRFKDNDAIATFRLAVCLEKLDRPDDARAEYDSYLKILPHGPLAEEAQKSMERLKDPAAKAAK
jgi:tetratricopeptide (TPR) repeat protein